MRLIQLKLIGVYFFLMSNTSTIKRNKNWRIDAISLISHLVFLLSKCERDVEKSLLKENEKEKLKNLDEFLHVNR